MLPHERLRAWQACHSLWIAVFQITERWPANERYGLTAQVKRAALSASANIAEGAAKRGSRDYARHLNIAIGSLAEVAALLLAARDVGVLDQSSYEELFKVQQQASLLTMMLYKAIRNSAKRQPPQPS